MPLISREYFFAILCVLIAMISIQSGASIAKQLFTHIGPDGVSAYRIGFSAIILCVIFRPWRNRPKNRYPLIIYGMCLGGMNVCFYYSIDRIPLGIAVALEFLGPLAVAIFSAKRKIDIMWAMFAILGVFLLLPDINHVDGLDPVGVLLALLAGAFWAGYILFGKRTGASGSPGSIVAIGMLIAAVMIVPFATFTQGYALLNVSLIPIGIAIGVLSSALPYSLEMFALHKMTSKDFSIFMSVEPAIGAVAAFIILGELLTISQWLAILMVITASVGSAATTQKS